MAVLDVKSVFKIYNKYYICHTLVFEFWIRGEIEINNQIII